LAERQDWANAVPSRRKAADPPNFAGSMIWMNTDAPQWPVMSARPKPPNDAVIISTMSASANPL
jgi:hypothetical protein